MSIEPEEDPIDSLSFSVDAGLIDRLGRELVGRAETALSELVKNAYDADATAVAVNFVETQEKEGTLIIEDNGVGMNLKQLQKGFMTISSTDKVHNPRSLRYNRSKAGRKGIGRFATQRLGKVLTITTQTLDSEFAIRLVIDWNKYQMDNALTAVTNPFTTIPKERPEGTTLLIEGLRDIWDADDIANVYRYVSELLQPDYISDRSQSHGISLQRDQSFKVSFSQTIDGQELTVADPDKIIFDKALAVIEGYVDHAHDGYCSVTSASLDLPDDIIEIAKKDDGTADSKKFKKLNELHFKAYYFIYQREKYYAGISKMELTAIQKLSAKQGGIRVYRNGFRVLPYGEPKDDWLDIDRRYYNESGTNVPFGNRNLFGFVEIIDPNGDLFEETASREGIIASEAYKELTDFVHKALEAARNRVRYAVERLRTKEKEDKQKAANSDVPDKTTAEKLEDLAKTIDDITTAEAGETEDSQKSKRAAQRAIKAVTDEVNTLLEELGMIRVLAGLGLTIGEFTHEVVQFSPSILGDLSVLSNQNLNEAGIKSLENVKRTIQVFMSYTSYFNSSISANVSRELRPQVLERVIIHFRDIIEADLEKLGIEFSTEQFGYDLITLPMHASEWSSILFNLYTNAKKAIRRKGNPGRIKIVIGKEEKNRVYLEFTDNGDGIPPDNRSRIFDAFFTTSSPVGFDASENDKLTGTGLGLKIVKDIIQTYGGTISLIDPEVGYATCFKILLPLATPKQLAEYAL